MDGNSQLESATLLESSNNLAKLKAPITYHNIIYFSGCAMSELRGAVLST